MRAEELLQHYSDERLRLMGCEEFTKLLREFNECSYADNPEWYDDDSDAPGWVRAEFTSWKQRSKAAPQHIGTQGGQK